MLPGLALDRESNRGAGAADRCKERDFFDLIDAQLGNQRKAAAVQLRKLVSEGLQLASVDLETLLCTRTASNRAELVSTWERNQSGDDALLLLRLCSTCLGFMVSIGY